MLDTSIFCYNSIMEKRIKIIVIVFSLLLLMGISSPFFINGYIQKTTKDKIVEISEINKDGLQAIIILGAGVKIDGSPSMMLKDRLDTGYEVYLELEDIPIIVSGDHGQRNYDEVNAMKKYLIDLGVPSKDIFMDHAGFSTYESIYRARDVFELDKAVIITQEYHLYRALYIADKLNVDFIGVDSNIVKSNVKNKDHIREFLARNKDFVKTMFAPEPTYLGDVIPVSGSGDITND